MFWAERSGKAALLWLWVLSIFCSQLLPVGHWSQQRSRQQARRPCLKAALSVLSFDIKLGEGSRKCHSNDFRTHRTVHLPSVWHFVSLSPLLSSIHRRNVMSPRWPTCWESEGAVEGDISPFSGTCRTSGLRTWRCVLWSSANTGEGKCIMGYLAVHTGMMHSW